MDPGTALAIVSLTYELFAGCIKGFVLVSDARNMGKDAAVERTKLILQEYRLIEWARAIRLDADSSGNDNGSQPRLPRKHPAALVLFQLEQLLTSTDSLKKRYKLELVAPPDGSEDLVLTGGSAGAEGDSASSVLSSIVSTETRRSILQRASGLGKSNNVPRRLWWAAVDKAKFAKLVDDVTGLVDGLWSLLDMAQRTQTSHAVNETLQLTIQTSRDIAGLRDLQQSLYNDGAPGRMTNGLAASAGLKAQHVLLSSPAPDTAPAPGLDPSQLSSVAMLTATIGTASYQGSAVLIEEKRVPPKLKAKLRPRVQGIARLLSMPPTPSFQTLPCSGYTEEQTGFRLIFRLPEAAVRPVSLQALLSKSSGPLPDVGTRLRLAVQLCQTLLSFHTAGWLHKDVRSENIMMLPAEGSGLGAPHLCGFSFARQDSPTEISEQPTSDVLRDLYRHPGALGEPSEAFERHMDAYSLGCVLIEVAEWAPLRKIVRKRIDTSSSEVKLSDVASLHGWLHARYVAEGVAAFRLGTAFASMLALCIPAPAGQPSDLSGFYAALEGLVACDV